MELPFPVLHFTLTSGLDITREGSPSLKVYAILEGWALPLHESGFCLHSPDPTYTQEANTAGFGEAVEDNWGRR